MGAGVSDTLERLRAELHSATADFKVACSGQSLAEGNVFAHYRVMSEAERAKIPVLLRDALAAAEKAYSDREATFAKWSDASTAFWKEYDASRPAEVES